MSRLTYAAVATKPTDFVALTSLTVEEFQVFVPAFETAFQAHMATWRLASKRRQNRRYTPYANSPLPTPEDRLLFILSYLKQTPTQVYHGQLFALPQCKVNQWVHTLLPVLRATLRATGAAPSRTQAALAERLGATFQVAHTADDGPPPDAATPPLLPRRHRAPHPTPDRPDRTNPPLQRQSQRPYPEKHARDRCRLAACLPQGDGKKGGCMTNAWLITATIPCPPTVSCSRIGAFSALPWTACQCTSRSKHRVVAP